MNRHTKRFIVCALLYFFAGCSMGLLAVAMPDWTYRIRPLHAHINLMGWVSLMIMGVSYFVIPVFVHKNPYSDKLVTLHLILANMGIIGMTAASAAGISWLLKFSALAETASIYLFLFNIISTAIKGEPVAEIPETGRFLTAPNNEAVDHWASRFTQVATFYLVITSSIGLYMVLAEGGWSLFRTHFHLAMLGWITMMIIGVAYHIFPRFSGQNVKNPALTKNNYYLANTGIIMMAFSLAYEDHSGKSILSSSLLSLSGLIEALAFLVFVYNIWPSLSGAREKMGSASLNFIKTSLSYFLAGIAAGFGMAVAPSLTEQMLPVHAHINVLGWITMMIFGVGYYIIPEFAGKKLYSKRLAGFHFWIANIALLGFLCLLPFRNEETRLYISIFAALEFLSAFLFIYNIARSIFGKK